MNRFFFRIVILASLFIMSFDTMLAQLPTGSGVYVGGHIRRERPNTIKTLRESGFTYVILFNVDVQADGTLKTDGETICENGKYVFYNTQPYYVDDVRLLKTQPTSINRIEICIGGWGNGSYGKIKNLIDANGTGTNTMLYKNFKALLEAVPGIDAVNNDQEQDYDVSSAVKFHTMMYDLGLKTTIAPYMNKNYWTSFVNQLNAARPGACDRVLIQCYEGGASNNPSDWKLGGLEVHAGRTDYQSAEDVSIAQMQTWHDNNGVTGGFVWIYNYETWNLNSWAIEMNKIFGTLNISKNSVATIFSSNGFLGDSLKIDVGEYGKGIFALAGLSAFPLSSFRVDEGYQLVAFKGNFFDGDSVVVTGECIRIVKLLKTRPGSFKVQRVEETAIEGITVDVDGAGLLFDSASRSVIISGAQGKMFNVYTTSGHKVFSIPVANANANLTLPLLPRGIYILSVGTKRMKVAL
ncbi:MAG: hypothetical protein IJK49_00285 [Prevotella sp.]|nr:hypothetical protein [Prevotella sp.]